MSSGSSKISRSMCEKLRHTAIADIHIEFLSDGTPTGDYANNFSIQIAHLTRE
jgi:hypothetical protein